MHLFFIQSSNQFTNKVIYKNKVSDWPNLIKLFKTLEYSFGTLLIRY